MWSKFLLRRKSLSGLNKDDSVRGRMCVYAPAAVLVRAWLPFPYLLLVALLAMWCRPVPLPPHSSKLLFSVSAATADKCCWKKTDGQKSRGERDWNNRPESVSEKAEESSAAEETAQRPEFESTLRAELTSYPPQYLTKAQNNSARNLLANPHFQVQGGLSSFIPALGRLGRKI